MSSAAIIGENSNPDGVPVYLYAIRSEIDSVEFYLANYPTEIAVSGLPDRFTAAGDPQAFSPAQITHGSVERRDGLERVSFDVTAAIKDVEFYSRFILFGMIPKIEVNVIKVVSGAAAAGVAVWGDDTDLVQQGLVETFSVEAHNINVRCTPEPFFTNQVVPRWRFTRTCNRQLFSPDCTVARNSFEHQNAITALDIDLRQVTVSGQKAGSSDGYFRGGVFEHTLTGTKTTILDHVNAGGNTVLTLQAWIPELLVTDNAVLNAGCNHSFNQCRDRFSNEANFGGFRKVPNRNPTLHGAG